MDWIQFQTMGQLLQSVLSSLPIWNGDKTVKYCNVIYLLLQTTDGIVMWWLGTEFRQLC